MQPNHPLIVGRCHRLLVWTNVCIQPLGKEGRERSISTGGLKFSLFCLHRRSNSQVNSFLLGLTSSRFTLRISRNRMVADRDRPAPPFILPLKDRVTLCNPARLSCHRRLILSQFDSRMTAELTAEKRSSEMSVDFGSSILNLNFDSKKSKFDISHVTLNHLVLGSSPSRSTKILGSKSSFRGAFLLPELRCNFLRLWPRASRLVLRQGEPMSFQI